MTAKPHRLRAASLALTAVVCVGEAAGCRDLLGVEHREVGEEGDVAASTAVGASTGAVGPSSGSGGAWSIPDACGLCVASSCAEAAEQCGQNVACTTLADCMLAAPDDPIGRVACLRADRATAESGAFVELDACLRGPCQTECYVGGRGLFARYGTYRETCVEALEAELPACVAEADCERLAVEALADPDGIDPASYEPLRHAVGTAGAAERAFAEKFTKSEDDCRDGPNLACVGAYEWPFPEIGVTSVPFEGSLPVQFHLVPHYEPGIVVQGCFSADDCSATEPFHTDDDGLATTPALAIPATGFRSYFRIDSGSSSIPAFPTLAFAGFPIHDAVRLDAFVASEYDAAQFINFGEDGQLHEGRGLLFLIFLDCQENVIPGLTVEFPAAFLDGATQTYLGGDSTGLTGTVGVLNAPPGCVEYRARDGAGNETHRARLLIEAGRASLASSFPRTATGDRIVDCAQPEFPLPD